MNTSRTLFAALVSCALNLALAQSALAAEEFRGHWTLEPSKEADHVRFGLSHHSRDGSSQHESDWPVSAFQGGIPQNALVVARHRPDVSS